MKKLLLGLIFLVCGLVNAQETPVVTNPTFWDDSYVQVPLQFAFPFYGKTFTNSWMHSNGVVSFLDPNAQVPNAAYNPGSWAYCCEGIPPTINSPEFSYMITPLWTDLYPVGSSTFRTEGTSTYQKYFWNNIAEISNMNNLNSFSLEIRPTGFIGANYTQINIQNQNTWIGTIGDPTKSEWNQIYYGRGVPSTLPNWSLEATGAVDLCTTDPLSSPTCPLYTQTMCAANPLYSTQCSGYAAAYYNQQCSSNPLYDPYCPGYASAYLDYQCSLDPLYSTTCQGYADAYFKQQCSNDPLYDSTCPGYDAAYLQQQCSANPLYATTCDGYAAAYHDQQCSINPLYATDCQGYATAYLNQQCGINPLYSTQCTGYAAAYFDQQCNNNQLYDKLCPGYAEAYALKNIVTATVEPTVVATPVATTSETVATVAVIADPVVNNVVTSTTTSASPATTATAPVSLTPSTTTTTTVASTSTTEEKKDASTSSVSGTASTSTANSGTETKTDAKPTARQELQQRRVAAAKAKAIEEGKNLAGTIGDAVSMEQQKHVQNVVIAAMGFTPGFDNYNKIVLHDGAMYKPFTVYNKQENVDNVRLGRRMYGPSDRLHEDMVSLQWELK